MVKRPVKVKTRTEAGVYVGVGLLTAVGIGVVISLTLAAFVAMNGDMCYDPYACGQATIVGYSK